MTTRNIPTGEPVPFHDRILNMLRWFHWPSLISGAAIGFAALHLNTTGTLLTQVNHLEQRIAAVDVRTRDLAGAADSASNSVSLLAMLQAQGERVDAARHALDAMSDFQRSVAISTQETDEARLAADRWHDLSEMLIGSQQRQTQSIDAIHEIDALQQDVVALGTSAETAQRQLIASRDVLTDVANLQSQLAETAQATAKARSAIDGINELQQKLITADEQRATADESATGLIALQESLSSVDGLESASANADSLMTLKQNLMSTPDIETATANADRLLTLQETLVNDTRLDLDTATKNAETMVTLQESLSGQTGRIAASIENLNLLADFQDELTEQLGQVEFLRHQLTELMLLETTLTKTMSALSPLTELGNLQRLDEQEMREVARNMLDRRRERVATASSKYEAKDATPPETTEEDRLVPEPPVE